MTTDAQRLLHGVRAEARTGDFDQSNPWNAEESHRVIGTSNPDFGRFTIFSGNGFAGD